MGCHTWFYIKLDEMKTQSLKFQAMREIKATLWDFSNKEEIEESKKTFGWSEEEIERNFKFYKRLESLLKKGYLKDFTTLLSGLYFYHNGNYYIEVCDTHLPNKPHDIFRVGSYPNNVLTSLEDTIKFCKDFESELYFCYEEEEAWRRIKEFWINHPDGLITFG